MSGGNPLHRFARALGAGKLLLYGYHRPMGLIRKSIAEGGPLEQIRTEQGRRQMVQAAWRLPVLVAKPERQEATKVNFLSGQRFWYQTLACFVSLQQHSPFRITPVIHDDGTLGSEICAAISRVVPWAVVVDARAINETLDRELPEARFPVLRARREVYPHLRKLTDIHLGQNDWGLVLDSDMLFFRRPEALLSWFMRPHAIYMQDVVEAYGYSSRLMRELAGCPVPAKVNVGLYAVDRSQIDWDAMEFWCRIQLEREKSNYLQEQALTAVLLARQTAAPLLVEDYRVMPDLLEGAAPRAVMHHYVAASKRSYFQRGWRNALALRGNAA
ncbi:glycosyl transferase [Bosea sp. 124]|uniref:glycosyl transferase n=1 Tax=Bosea sp. 124 TaxID=2135642 RepID=UPI000D408238|nr:glycosyl transferase [Bosea sp. 124]PTM41748.1 hypothetical protein C8D03_3321 [Bosea sp. 124]